MPDHSTVSKHRHGRFRDSDLLRELFETTVARCTAVGLLGGKDFAVGAGVIKADANRQWSVPGSEGLPLQATSFAVREYLKVLEKAALSATRRITEVGLDCRPGLTLERCQWRAGVLHLLHRLPHRAEA